MVPSCALMGNATYQYRRASSPSVNDRKQTDLLILDFSKAFDKVGTQTSVTYIRVLWQSWFSLGLDKGMAH